MPKLDIGSVHKLLCGLNCRIVGSTIKFDGAFELAIPADEIRLVMGHMVLPFVWAGAQYSQSPVMPGRRSGDGNNLPRTRPDILVNTDHLSEKLTNVAALHHSASFAMKGTPK
jgi:hypothetical protein